jgi:hypothetical protein
MIRRLAIFLVPFTLLACSDLGEKPPAAAVIFARVHWQDQGIPNIPVVLVQTRDSVQTDSKGLATFSVSPGSYTVRAFGIKRGGPVLEHVDFDIEAKEGETTFVDIVDCLPCL